MKSLFVAGWKYAGKIAFSGAGNAVATNVDYYYVEIDQMPDFNQDGQPDSDQQVTDAIRANFAGLASGEKEGFDFTCMAPAQTDNIWWEFKPYEPEIDNVSWSFPAPVYKNTVFFIDAGTENPVNNYFADKGAIIISQATNCCWVGSTINTPLSGSQPFSGQRQWGLTTLPNGKKAFYTKAADRAFNPSFLLKAAASIPGYWNCDDDTYYNIANVTWVNLMTKVGQFIEAGGGIVPGSGNNVIYNVVKARIDFDELDGKLRSNSPVSFITCH